MTKKYNKTKKPNGVLFKLDGGQLVAILIVYNRWDWENCKVIDMSSVEDVHKNLSAKDPFEFVYILWDEKHDKLTTFDKKTIVPNASFYSLFEENKLLNLIESDYKSQFGELDTQ